MIRPVTLPPAPAAILTEEGQVRFGRFAGQVGKIDWSALRPPHARGAWWRYFHHKRWQYVALATEEIFCGIAIVDLGWISTAFAYVFDRRQRREVAGFSQDGLPGLAGALIGGLENASASRFAFLGKRIEYRRHPGTGTYQLNVDCGQFEIDATFDAGNAAPLLLALGPIAGGAVHATQKSSAMPLQGAVRIKGKGGGRYDLNGGLASFDYSNGLLARETAWRWASAHSLELGFNLQAGYFGAHENALWLDGKLYPLGNAHFATTSENPLAQWHIHTDDGLLDLHFQPEGARRQNKNLLLAVSRYVQPIGTFSGWVKAAAGEEPRQVRALVGVTEDHYSRW